MNVKLVAVTPDAEQTMKHIAGFLILQTRTMKSLQVY